MKILLYFLKRTIEGTFQDICAKKIHHFASKNSFLRYCIFPKHGSTVTKRRWLIGNIVIVLATGKQLKRGSSRNTGSKIVFSIPLFLALKLGPARLLKFVKPGRGFLGSLRFAVALLSVKSAHKKNEHLVASL